MSLSSSRVGYRHRCTIERDEAEPDGAWGGPGTPDWQTHIADLPCRAWTATANEQTDDRRTAVVVQRRISIAVGTDVTERDRVASVTDRGNTLYEGPMDIEGILRYPDHWELILELIR